MPSFEVNTGRNTYPCLVERGALSRVADFIPARTGKIFVVTTEDVWRLYRDSIHLPHSVLLLPGGESNKRFQHVETLAEQMVEAGADRTSLVIALGGGIVNDMGGFLASIFMRGVPVVQIPTTLLAQVDAAVGGKTGVNLRVGKNLLGTFHQPLAVIIDPQVLASLPPREYRAGLFEVIKHGIIASAEMFRLLTERSSDVLTQQHDTVDFLIAESVRIKAEVVSADEREGDLRRILNFGHTVGHALEAETRYQRLLHGEAVAFGMKAATQLARMTGMLLPEDCEAILHTISLYGPIPDLSDIRAEALAARLVSDKKTVGGKVHWVLPDRIGHVQIVSGIDNEDVLRAIRAA